MPMDEFDSAVHRTLVEYLIRTRQPDIAAVILDGEVELSFGENDFGSRFVERYSIDVPAEQFALVGDNDRVKKALSDALRKVAGGQYCWAGRVSIPDDFPIVFRIKLLPSEEGWQVVARSLITNPKGANQALVSDIASDGRPLHKWNELRYASASEVRIAQELERRKVLFFPLAVAVRAETGKNWQDHREVDFLVYENGVWGILEVAYHPNRYEQDSEKDLWFKRSGVLCVQHFTAERCYNEPKVVSEFLAVLAQHKK
jgi:hypothetical protein